LDNTPHTEPPTPKHLIGSSFSGNANYFLTAHMDEVEGKSAFSKVSPFALGSFGHEMESPLKSAGAQYHQDMSLWGQDLYEDEPAQQHGSPVRTLLGFPSDALIDESHASPLTTADSTLTSAHEIESLTWCEEINATAAATKVASASADDGTRSGSALAKILHDGVAIQMDHVEPPMIVRAIIPHRRGSVSSVASTVCVDEESMIPMELNVPIDMDLSIPTAAFYGKVIAPAGRTASDRTGRSLSPAEDGTPIHEVKSWLKGTVQSLIGSERRGSAFVKMDRDNNGSQASLTSASTVTSAGSGSGGNGNVSSEDNGTSEMSPALVSQDGDLPQTSFDGLDRTLVNLGVDVVDGGRGLGSDAMLEMGQFSWNEFVYDDACEEDKAGAGNNDVLLDDMMGQLMNF
jgi:hypothetical protein